MTWDFGLHGFIQGNAPFYLPLSQGYKERTKNVFCPDFLNQTIDITEFIIIDFLSGFANKSTVACRLMESLREFTFVTKDWANKPTFYSPSSLTGDSLYEWNFLNLDKQSVDQSLNRRSPALVLQYFDLGLPSFLFNFHNHVYRCLDLYVA